MKKKDKFIIIPLYLIIYPIAFTVSSIVYFIIPIRRSLVLKNIERALNSSTDKKISFLRKHQIGFLTYFNFAILLLEFLFFPILRRYWESLTVFEGTDPVKEILQKKTTGIYILCLHMGNWEWMAMSSSQKFAPIYALLKPFKPEFLYKYLIKRRQEYSFYSLINSHPKILINHIKEGHLLGMIVDQRYNRGTLVTHFGEDCLTNLSLLRLWHIQEAPVFPCYCIPLGWGKHKLIAKPEWKPIPHESFPEFLKINAPIMQKIIEGIILEYPQYYFWFHNRFKIPKKSQMISEL